MGTYKASFLKKLASYFFDLRIEQVYSETNKYLEIVLSKGRFQLNSSNATYSFEDLYGSYGSALEKIQPDSSHIQSVLVLGLGLGSIPYFLQKKYHLDCMIDCVEIDAVIIELAKKYYPDDAQFSQLNIHHADAVEWINQSSKKFDLITVDLFIDINVPFHLHSIHFISELKSHLATNGEILFSRLKRNKNFENQLWKNMSLVFPEAKEIETTGNSIMYWKNSGN